MVSLVPVAGVLLPADELAQAVDAYVVRRLLDDRSRRTGPAFNAGPWLAARDRLDSSASAEHSGCGWSRVPLLGCAEYGSIHGRASSTVRGWAAQGRLPGATRRGRDWQIPATTPPPPRRKATL